MHPDEGLQVLDTTESEMLRLTPRPVYSIFKGRGGGGGGGGGGEFYRQLQFHWKIVVPFRYTCMGGSRGAWPPFGGGRFLLLPKACQVPLIRSMAHSSGK